MGGYFIMCVQILPAVMELSPFVMYNRHPAERCFVCMHVCILFYAGVYIHVCTFMCVHACVYLLVCILCVCIHVYVDSFVICNPSWLPTAALCHSDDRLLFKGIL